MRGVSFRSANLAGSDLRCSQLKDVDFTDAYLTSAVLGDEADSATVGQVALEYGRPDQPREAAPQCQGL